MVIRRNWLDPKEISEIQMREVHGSDFAVSHFKVWSFLINAEEMENDPNNLNVSLTGEKTRSLGKEQRAVAGRSDVVEVIQGDIICDSHTDCV